MLRVGLEVLREIRERDVLREERLRFGTYKVDDVHQVETKVRSKDVVSVLDGVRNALALLMECSSKYSPYYHNTTDNR